MCEKNIRKNMVKNTEKICLKKANKKKGIHEKINQSKKINTTICLKKRNKKERIAKNRYHNMSEEDKQKKKEYQKS